MKLDPETDLSFTRKLAVPRALVWECWTTPEHIRHFFVPRPHEVTSCEIDLRVGGRFNTVMKVGAHEMDNKGVYLEVVDGEKLVFTDAYSEGWKPAPDPFMTAIILLIFKDTILSLVASVQLTSLDMVRVGDWLEMPQYNADGDVIDVALHTVTVQNWDKTITTIPTHRLISESYKNWRAMSESGGRRIKRSIDIDISSVRFLTDDEMQRFEAFTLLREYVARKRTELSEYNVALKGPDSAKVNLRRLTNLGTFRAYIWNYLRNHPEIHREMTLLVRQLQPGDTGIPIEIYCFTNTTEWAAYEDIQADIFDHILAQCGEFDLRVFQALSGADVKTRLAGSSANFGATDP